MHRNASNWCGARARRGRKEIASSKFGSRRHREVGFTLLELMIVLVIILILASFAVPAYNQQVIKAREAVLHANLNSLNNLIQQYTLDKQKAPQSLDDLVAAGYVHEVPVDPMTHLPNWETEPEDLATAADPQEPGISRVHSAATGSALDGTAYSSWSH